jgi:hypothetical protein
MYRTVIDLRRPSPQRMLFDLAGSVATELIGEGRLGIRTDQANFRHDLDLVILHECHDRLVGDKDARARTFELIARKVVIDFRQSIHHLVQESRPAIESVAESLLEAEELHGSELAKAFRDAGLARLPSPVSPMLEKNYWRSL